MLDLHQPRIFLEFVLLSGLLTVGCYTAYMDVRFRRLPNRWVYGLLGGGLLGQLMFLDLLATSWSNIGLVFAGGFVVSYLLYAYGFWAPGDAKLYWAVVVALPPSLVPVHDAFSMNDPLWAIFINSVVLSFLFIAGLLVSSRRSRARLAASIREARVDAKSLLRTGARAVALAGIALMATAFVIERPMVVTENLLLLMVLFLASERLVPPSYESLYVWPGAAAWIYLSWITGSWLDHLIVAALGAAIMAAFFFIRDYYASAFVQRLAVDDLRPGLTPHRSLYMEKDPGTGRRRYTLGEAGGPDRHTLCRAGVPLTGETVSRLKQVKAGGALEGIGDRIEIEGAIPFAPFITAGTAVTVLAAGTLTRLLP